MKYYSSKVVKEYFHEMDLLEFLKDYCAESDRLQICVVQFGKDTFKVLANVTSGDSYILGVV